MSQRRKLIEKIRRRPVEASIRDVQELLEGFGWKLDRVTGSHFILGKPGELSINVPTVKGRPVKPYYLDRIGERLGLDDLDSNDLED